MWEEYDKFIQTWKILSAFVCSFVLVLTPNIETLFVLHYLYYIIL